VGILKGVRGPRGGYELARERRRITAGEIVRAAMVDDLEDGVAPLPESKLVEFVVQPLVERAGEKFLADLDALTVDDLCRQAAEKSIFDETSARADFTI